MPERSCAAWHPVEIESDAERRRLWPRRRNFTIFVVSATVLLWLVLALAGPARADDQSYLDQLAAAGVPMNPMNSQAAMLQRGDAACRLLQAHVPPDQVAGQLGFNGWMWNQKIVDVAQRELCPGAQR